MTFPPRSILWIATFLSAPPFAFFATVFLTLNGVDGGFIGTLLVLFADLSDAVLYAIMVACPVVGLWFASVAYRRDTASRTWSNTLILLDSILILFSLFAALR
jgi:hypothetical protein